MHVYTIMYVNVFTTAAVLSEVEAGLQGGVRGEDFVNGAPYHESNYSKRACGDTYMHFWFTCVHVAYTKLKMETLVDPTGPGPSDY